MFQSTSSGTCVYVSSLEVHVQSKAHAIVNVKPVGCSSGIESNSASHKFLSASTRSPNFMLSHNFRISVSGMR